MWLLKIYMQHDNSIALEMVCFGDSDKIEHLSSSLMAAIGIRLSRLGYDNPMKEYISVACPILSKPLHWRGLWSFVQCCFGHRILTESFVNGVRNQV